MATRFLKDLPKDLDRHISSGFNKTIKQVHQELSSKENSPVWTGFFASSWKAQGTPVQAVQKTENYEPWKSIKMERSIDYFVRKKAGPPYAKQTRPKNPKIEPRFPVGSGKRVFNYKRPVYIGNTAAYSIYALESTKIQNFVQGGKLAEIINDNMSEKGKLFVGGSTSTGFGSVSEGESVRYTEF
tara:strand:+ start:355 stop:909 length:555 start_codon:yes stop_codon:yes gene_type:complete